MSTKHYTAVIIVNETKEKETDQYGKEKSARSVHEIAHITVRGSTLEGLKNKISGHVELVGED